jgi:hypothetical protein
LDHQRGGCPAYGKKCFECQGMNHFGRQCKLKQIKSDGDDRTNVNN